MKELIQDNKKVKIKDCGTSYDGCDGICRKLLLKNKFSEVYDIELPSHNKHIVFDRTQLDVIK